MEPMTTENSENTSAVAAAKSSGSGNKKKVAKVPKGARDFLPEQMRIREIAFTIVSSIFEKHGAVTIDTPVFELKDTLTDQYGEDSKLIYDLADQGGELLALRYDLTVPFARYLATHKIQNIKRFHIARVYRRDQPAIQRGRFREFYQCDLDIAGVYPAMVPDAEILSVLTELLDALSARSQFHYDKLGHYKIKLNHRTLLDAVFTTCGVPESSLRAISSSIDKLDKESWETVKQEMTQKKGLDVSAADKIGEYVCIRGEFESVLSRLRNDSELQKIAGSCLDEMERLMTFLNAMGDSVTSRIEFDLSLARGLDYYTGVIFEAVLVDKSSGPIGSIAAGGRYDKLVGSFSGRDTPCVGCSLGIERVMALMEAAESEWAKHEKRSLRASKTQVLVASVGSSATKELMMVERMRLASELWKNGIATEFSYAENPKMQRQLAYALENGIPLVAIIGEDELKQGIVQLKVLSTESQSAIPREELSNAIRKLAE
mmetsp:Transcript_9447/g.17048  ORF Transcript_9447/g.17048 Transcript_9447/m.17048 type:complete len:489 (-) Transcript_9447:1093-2559(-)